MSDAKSARNADLATWRVYIFRAGLGIAILTLVATILCWADPFPLVHLPNGSLWVGLWLDRVFVVAECGSLATLGCGFSGRGGGRVGMCIAGMLLMVVSFWGWLGNSV